MKTSSLLFLILIFPALLQGVFAQGVDSVRTAPPQSIAPLAEAKGLSRPQKAMLYSIVPGGGQLYNGKYWKVPVIYAGFGVLTYTFLFYNDLYGETRQAYKEKINNQPVSNPDYENVPTEMLYNWRESYKKYRDLSAIGILTWYTFNIIDAAVDAHLKEFDVGESLSLKISPNFQISPVGQSTGLQLKLRF